MPKTLLRSGTASSGPHETGRLDPWSGLGYAGRSTGDDCVRVRTSVEEFRPLVATVEGKELINRLQADPTNWRPVGEEIKRLLDQGNAEEALKIATENGLPHYESNTRDSRRLRAIQDEILSRETEAGTSLARTSTWTRSCW